ncbi:MAG: FG-GAP repeat protein [Nannocystis sp.]|nr:FG-GAP repeat protein [Nannocystis sp.]
MLLRARVALFSAFSLSACTGDDPPPNAGLAVDDFYRVVSGKTLVVEADAGLLANDEGEPTGVISAMQISEKLGTVVVERDGSFAYAPLAGYWGLDTFTYRIDDEERGQSAAKVNLMVIPVTLGLGGIAGTSRGYVIDGVAAADRLGSLVAGLGDINGDGVDDLAIGAPLADDAGPDSGRALMVLGGSARPSASSVAAGEHGFVISGRRERDRLGSSISGAGDLSGDGLAELLVCAPRAELVDAISDDVGVCYVVFGRPEFGASLELGELAAGGGGFAIHGEGWQARAGLAAVGGVDVDGDGRGDLAIGAPGYSEGGLDRGRVHVVFGRSGGEAVELADLGAGGAGGFVIDGLEEFEWAGAAVGLIGDLNGDGRGEVLVGAPFATVDERDYAGRVYLVYGRAAGDEAAPDVVFRSGSMGGGHTGAAATAVGDFNGDGAPDFAIGAPQVKLQPGLREGRVYVVFGAASLPAEVDLTALAADGRGLVIDGEAQRYGQSGLVIAPAGDLDGDGRDDLLLGAPTADVGQLREAGRAYVVFGREQPGVVSLADVARGEGGFAIDGESEESRAGWSVAAPGDINGDDVLDVIVGAPSAAINGAESGRAYVIYGFGPPRSRAR